MVARDGLDPGERRRLQLIKQQLEGGQPASERRVDLKAIRDDFEADEDQRMEQWLARQRPRLHSLSLWERSRRFGAHRIRSGPARGG